MVTFVIWESAAIAFYLNEKFQCPAHWFGRDAQQRGLIQQFLQWYAYTLRLGGGAFHWTIFAPMIYGDDKDFSAEIKKGRYLLYESLDLLETYWLKDREYLCGDEISYADLSRSTRISFLMTPARSFRTGCGSSTRRSGPGSRHWPHVLTRRR